ncbi:MAG: response regulator transcription factor, partial [Blastopirellula sp. JB062]
FSARGYDVYAAANYEEAISQAEEAQPERAVLDLKMPGKSGLELLRDLRQISPETKAVLLTGYGSISNAVEAIRLGAVNYVTKPADADEILAAFDQKPPEDPSANQIDYQPQSLAEAEWEHIHRVLDDCGGNLSEAARLLGIPRRTLQRKLKKLAP